MVRTLVMTMLATASLAAAPSEEQVRRELDRLEGTWRVVSAEAGGMAIPAREHRDLRLTFKDGAFTATRGSEPRQEGTFTIDPSTNPRKMDITRTVGKGEIFKQQAIYHLAGNLLKICASATERPTDFQTRDRPDCTLMVLRREP